MARSYPDNLSRSRRCDEPCCEMSRVAESAVLVESVEQLVEVLRTPEVFWWPEGGSDVSAS